MKRKQVIQSLIPFKKNLPLYYQKTDSNIHYYQNSELHTALVVAEKVIEITKEGIILKVFKEGELMYLNYSVGIDYPVESLHLFEHLRIDTEGKFIFLTPLGKNSEAAYWLKDLSLELQPDIYNADCHMVGGPIID